MSEGIASLFFEYQARAGITDDQVHSYARDDDGLIEKGDGIHKGWLKAIARAMEDLLPTRGKFLCRTFLRQAAAYLEKPGLKARIDGLVREQAFHNHRCD